MTNFKKQTFSVLAAGAMLLNVAAPALAGTTVEISGNGSGSENWSTVEETNRTNVDQNNNATVNNDVESDANTGKNDADFNTGGDVQVGTGHAESKVNVQNELNTNSADVDCCDSDDTNVEISGNGAHSNNGAVVDNDTRTNVDQDNRANVTNDVESDANTGKNDANSNTGGDVQIGTGNAVSKTDVSTKANVNAAKVGSDKGLSSNPSASYVIKGNGAGSDNYITASSVKKTNVDQDNNATVNNDVESDADSGKNDADFNTGGDVLIGTGHAVAMTDVDNAVNFNHADVDCGCTTDVLAKISGNGADKYGEHSNNPLLADNIIDLTLDSRQAVGQNNGANLDNDANADADTGKNDAGSNTGEVDGISDPSIGTGDAYIESGVSNSGNVNTVGSMPDWSDMDLPNVDVSFSMASIWAMFGMSL